MREIELKVYNIDLRKILEESNNMEKRGDFREGESRSDFDMTKKAEAFDKDGFTAGTNEELKRIETKEHTIVENDNGSFKFIKKD